MRAFDPEFHTYCVEINRVIRSCQIKHNYDNDSALFNKGLKIHHFASLKELLQLNVSCDR